MLAGKRAVRVGDQILKEIALLLLEKVKDPRIQGVTITGIHLSNNLKQAKVYYSVIGEKEQIEKAQEGLNSAKGFIKREIGLGLQLRYVPEIIFLHDPSLENGSHMERLFEEIGKEETGSEAILNQVATVLKEGKQFLLMTHNDPDFDGIGSMLALGKVLLNAGKDVVVLSEDPVPAPFNLLKGSNMIVQGFDEKMDFDTVVLLDCGDLKRLNVCHDFFEGRKFLINIDHHETNDFFGNLNLVDSNSSSTGELVFRVIIKADLPIDSEVAENIFAAIHADTGSFSYENTTSASFKIAAKMMEYGVKPWEVSRKVMGGYSLSRLRLLEMALGNIEFHHEGKIGMMVLSLEMLKKAQANKVDSERFVNYPRFVYGVVIAVLIRQTDENNYKFSLRSNSNVNVAELASKFGGGGHARAAGFESHGSLETLKKNFLKEASKLIDGISN